jgi:hypothetical protein
MTATLASMPILPILPALPILPPLQFDRASAISPNSRQEHGDAR